MTDAQSSARTAAERDRRPASRPMPARSRWSPLSTLVGLWIAPRWGTAAVDLIYLPAVLAAAALWGLGPALFAGVAVGARLQFLLHRAGPHLPHRPRRPTSSPSSSCSSSRWSPASSPPASASRRGSPHAHAARNATIAGFARRLLSSQRRSRRSPRSPATSCAGCSTAMRCWSAGCPSRDRRRGAGRQPA